MSEGGQSRAQKGALDARNSNSLEILAAASRPQLRCAFRAIPLPGVSLLLTGQAAVGARSPLLFVRRKKNLVDLELARTAEHFLRRAVGVSFGEIVTARPRDEVFH